MEPGSQIIGKVIILYGTVKAIAADGTERILGPNSDVYANERIVTDSGGSVSIMLNGPPPTQLDLGRMSDVLLDEDVYAGAEQVAGRQQLQIEPAQGEPPQRGAEQGAAVGQRRAGQPGAGRGGQDAGPAGALDRAGVGLDPLRSMVRKTMQYKIQDVFQRSKLATFENGKCLSTQLQFTFKFNAC
ncbi:MAG: hypothetical protein R6T92_13295 [Desulfosalsimonadaceae bacterium]